jgi:hypothetical protein
MKDGKLENPARFKDISEIEKQYPKLVGEKVRIQDVIGKKILVTAYVVLDGKFTASNCVQFQYILVDENRLCITFSGSKVIFDQLDRNGANLPFLASIKKKDNKYLKLESVDASPAYSIL